MKKAIFYWTCCMLLTVFLISTLPSVAQCEKPKAVPPSLSEWSSWVLHGKETTLCPTSWNDGDAFKCNWPSFLQLSVDHHGGKFEQTWLLFAEDWIALPGNPTAWPQSVRVGNTAVTVMDRDNTPCLSLPTGKHRVTGVFTWDKMPEMIQVPPALGLVSLEIDGQKIDSPEIDQTGRLWLQKRKETSDGSEEQLSVRVFRLIIDTIPMQITTRILLHVSGRAREITLQGLLMDQNIPLRIESPLPTKISADGALVCQVRPGQWDLRLTTRVLGPVKKLACNGRYGPEIWSFQSQNHLRMVDISGAPAVEPERTDMPMEWKNLPAYSLSPENELVLKEMKRGDPDPAPDKLTLHRTWWLDFDGRGLTLQDKITGAMSRQWYLAMNAPVELGRAAVDGIDQLITRQGHQQTPGIALRRGNLNLEADSRIESRTRQVPAVGWDHDFDRVSGSLNLPPGWRLLGTTGIDTISGTWIQNWTLLDFFLALIIGLSVMKLRNPKWGALALVTMILIFHEPGAPRLVWINIIWPLALLKRLEKGWVRTCVTLWGGASIITLLAIAIPFMVMQIRWSVYPQLAQVNFNRSTSLPVVNHRMMQASEMPAAPSPMVHSSAEKEMSPSDLRKKTELRFYDSLRSEATTSSEDSPQAITVAEPNALIQTGPGLPTWQWESLPISWNGPVDRTQTIGLWLISPIGNLVLGVIRTLLLACLMIGLINVRSCWPNLRTLFQHNQMTIVLMFLFLLGIGSAHATQTAYPPREMLNELQQRLLEKPDCLPHCASLSQMTATLDSDMLTLTMEIHAAIGTAVPLPTTLTAWTPNRILIDDDSFPGLMRDDSGTLWAYIPEGIHHVVMNGLAAGDVLRISLPLSPHTATIMSSGWTVKGIHPDGTTDSTLEFTRSAPAPSSQPGYGTPSLPPFFHVQRTLHLGLTWQLSTQIKRISPLGTPVMLSFPLLEGESVLTAGVHVENTLAQLSFAPQEETMLFESNLPPKELLSLKAPTSAPWTESWTLDASPIWQCEFSGIPPILHRDSDNNWQPQWSPWPGETVDIRISRPESIPGKTVTIDEADLDWTPGLRFNKAELRVLVRTSRSGQHDISLPTGANLQAIQVNGKDLPIRQNETNITIPLQPGAQTIQLTWHQPLTSSLLFCPPSVSVGGDAVNIHIRFHLPENRWILLTGGPRLGPAVLFWSYLVVVVLAAFGLKRIKLTPLKFHQWLLLGIGLTQIPPMMAFIVVGWLPAFGLRKSKSFINRRLAFNTTQLMLIGWTILALFGLYQAVETGLLGLPDMQIAGNQSSRHLLQWTQDRTNSTLPQPWTVGLPLWSYRVFMLLWSLWLAFSLLKWLQWGWQCFSDGALWSKTDRKNDGSENIPETPEIQTDPPPLEK